jgi:hypothetical protein
VCPAAEMRSADPTPLKGIYRRAYQAGYMFCLGGLTGKDVLPPASRQRYSFVARSSEPAVATDWKPAVAGWTLLDPHQVAESLF